MMLLNLPANVFSLMLIVSILSGPLALGCHVVDRVFLLHVALNHLILLMHKPQRILLVLTPPQSLWNSKIHFK